jgi:hypothetical protein
LFGDLEKIDFDDIMKCRERERERERGDIKEKEKWREIKKIK